MSQIDLCDFIENVPAPTIQTPRTKLRWRTLSEWADCFWTLKMRGIQLRNHMIALADHPKVIEDADAEALKRAWEIAKQRRGYAGSPDRKTWERIANAIDRTVARRKLPHPKHGREIDPPDLPPPAVLALPAESSSEIAIKQGPKEPASGAVLRDELGGGKKEAHRLRLWRTWDPDLPSVVFVGLNPSTADAVESDPTLTRMIGFAKREGFGGVQVINLYTYRTKNPREMWALPNDKRHCGSLQFAEIETACRHAKVAIICWGNGQATKKTDKKMLGLAAKIMVEDLRDHGMALKCFGRTKDGQPKHPLYLPKQTPLVAWED